MARSSPPRRAPLIHDLDELPSVLDVYKRDLTIPHYFNGYLQHPYLSLYTGRGCPAQCTFCLWPQTIGGHNYRVRTAQSVFEEMARAQKLFPEVKEFFFDDDTFTANRKRTEEVSPMLGSLGLTWSCNSRANVPYETLKIMRDNGLRLLLVGFESGNDRILRNIKKGVMVERMVRFMKDCKKLGIRVHGTFILGLPGETMETIKQTMDFAMALDPETIQVSLAAPYPGTELYSQAQENGWLITEQQLLMDNGVQDFPLQYPGVGRREVFDAVDEFYRKFYFRPKPILRIVRDMIEGLGRAPPPPARGQGVLPVPAEAAGGRPRSRRLSRFSPEGGTGNVAHDGPGAETRRSVRRQKAHAAQVRGQFVEPAQVQVLCSRTDRHLQSGELRSRSSRQEGPHVIATRRQLRLRQAVHDRVPHRSPTPAGGAGREGNRGRRCPQQDGCTRRRPVPAAARPWRGPGR